MSIDYYDKQGNPLTRDEYFALLIAIDQNYKRVAATDVRGVRLSTVWLGLDHGYDGEPLIFETMQFGGEGDGNIERYSTLEEAQAGHDAWVKRIQESE